MSPVPSPAPLRHSFTRFACSPSALLCGFVTLLVVTCPNARGVDGLGVVSLDQGSGAVSGSSDLLLLDVPAAKHPAHARTEQRSSVRLPTLEERGGVRSDVGNGELFRHSRVAVPLLVRPLATEGDASTDSAASIVPMTGPAVGVGVKSRSTRR